MSDSEIAVHKIRPDIWGQISSSGGEPKAISYPHEFDGSDRLNIWCTQTNLTPAKQKELVREWCELLPSLQNLRYLWFSSCVNQELFEAACRVPTLEGLYLKWNVLSDIRSIVALSGLKYLHLGNSGRLKSIEPLRELAHLAWLEVTGFSRTPSLEVLEGLCNLVGLAFVGVEGKKLSVVSLRPLESLANLEWLHIGALRVEDGSLEPIRALKKLRWLGIGNFFPKAQFASLSASFSSSVCCWFEPFARFHPSVFPCRKCKKDSKVMTSGSPSFLLCPSCESEKLSKQVGEFELARRVYGR